MADGQGHPELRRKECGRCGEAFACAEGTAGCWCESVTLEQTTLAELRALADDCLCPSCLAVLAEGDREESPRDPQSRAGWAKLIPSDTIRARGVPPVWGAAAAMFLAGAMLLGLAIGPVSIGAGVIVDSALSHLPLLHVRSHLGGFERAILWQLRAPRVVLAALVGGMLAIAGSAYQGVFRNPLADPYLLGVAAGAGLAAPIAP